jgi:predicted CopG family antitoxin
MQTKKIKIKKETYNRLIKAGKFGDSIDDILKRILDQSECIETKEIKTRQMTNTTMKLYTTNKQPCNPPILN